MCNFLDAPELEAFLGPKDDSDERWRVVYRNYATLYFVFVVDGAESELGILDLIQVSGDFRSVYAVSRCWNPKVFVEALDRAFENVCELDLVFHFDEVSFGHLGLLHTESRGQGSPYPCGDHPRRPRPRNERGGD